jgi:uncharacterized protein (DUF952 family)
MTTSQLIYKILDRALWQHAQSEGFLHGAPVDLADGYIHFSTVTQVAETAAKHFAGETDLVLLAVDTAKLTSLKWEPSRGGDLFPHLYGDLGMSAVLWTKPLPWDGVRHIFPELS